MMLGGSDGMGGEIYNKLTAMCLRASGELKLIDPKINLRVTKNTPLGVYQEGTKLTKVGLGFPQYSNDDVVIPALVNLGYDDEIAHLLRSESPKVGSADSDTADEQLVWLTEVFSASLRGKKNERGGIWRAGTGSAMFYLWHAEEIGASPDGRRRGEPFAANYSASLFAKIDDPVHIVKSFTKPDLAKVINGGPLTLEFDSKIFANEESMTKVASLVKYFVSRGGHQLQLNAVSHEALLDAQIHPEKYERLIVRIWGWSAYFVELDKGFQDHVIRRQEYRM